MKREVEFDTASSAANKEGGAVVWEYEVDDGKWSPASLQILLLVVFVSMI
eukprot:CAMPEP_0170078818 /NCGR_PEP_ID=MMETSP0019_2-20121128/15354_1 /TAXON_ID=98059 /ORGANISM="Dinobryon sp., Strain UTEXLB2267" /LENGTH=49 /DNA_ID=CAMNT_0010291965 /DNA_START=328 /DNA_END=477 /DNA_ORIENTATION=+